MSEIRYYEQKRTFTKQLQISRSTEFLLVLDFPGQSVLQI